MNYDIFLKKGTDSPVFKGRASGTTRTFDILNNVDNALVNGATYVAYVRPWRSIAGSYGYVNNIQHSSGTIYFQPPSITLDAQSDRICTDVSNISVNLNVGFDNDNITSNGATNIYYSVLIQSYTSALNSTDVSFTDWRTVVGPTFNLFGINDITLTKLGYYKVKIAITSYTNPNDTGYNPIYTNPLIYSNTVDFFVKAKPSIITNSFVTGTVSGNLTLTVDVYNNWSIINDGLAVIVPNNPASYTGSTINLYNRDTTYGSINNTSNATKFLKYNATNGLIDTPDFTFNGITAITQKFIIVTNAVGLNYYYN
jgi:hypothetical protein